MPKNNYTNNWPRLVDFRSTTVALIMAAGLNNANGAFDVRLYLDIVRDDALDVQTLIDDADFPDSPDISDYHNAAPDFFTPEGTSIGGTSGFVEWPQNGLLGGGTVGGDSGNDNYGGAVSGVFYPQRTGTYRFHIRSDDESSLYFNPNPIEGSASGFFLDPKADGVAPVAFEPTCCGGFEPLTSANETSEGFDLEVGKGYAIELLWQEGGGGDWFQVGTSFRAPGASSYSSASVIPAWSWQRDVRYGDGSNDGITSFGGDFEPIVAEGGRVSFGVEFDKDGVGDVSWEISEDDGDSWQNLSDGANIIGSGSPTITILVANAEFEELLFRPTVDGELGDEILVEIDADDDQPTVTSIDHRGNPGGFRIAVNEAIDPESVDLSGIRLDGEPLPAGTTFSVFGNNNQFIQITMDRSVFEFELDTTYDITIEEGAFTDPAFAKNEVEAFQASIIFGGGEPLRWDFNGGLPDDWTFFGDSEWRESGGVGDSGFLVINDGVNSQLGAAKLDTVVPAVTQVTFSFWARIGDSTANPADGFSFNVASDLPDGTYPQSEEGYAGGDDPATFPEGLVVAFDNWSSGGVDQGVGIEIKYQGQSRAFVAMDERTDGSVNDGSDGSIPSINQGDTWFPVSIALSPTGTATVVYNNVVVMDNVDVGWAGVSDAQVGFGGRTGDANESHWFDDLEINFDGGAVGDIEIASDPQPQTNIPEYNTFSFRVGPGGSTAGLSVQWFKDGEAIPGATTAVFSGEARPSAEGIYHAEVSNEFSGPAVSAPAALTVLPDTAPPTLTGVSGTPLNQSVIVSFDEPVSLAGGGSTSVLGEISGIGVATDGSVVIDYKGVLEGAASVVGPWTQLGSSAEGSQYSEPLDAMAFYRVQDIAGGPAGAATFSVSALDGSVLSVGTPSVSGNSVIVPVDGLEAGTRYVVSYSGIGDLAESPNASSGSQDFLTFDRTVGGLTVLFYEIAGAGLGVLADAEPGEYPDGYAAFGAGNNLENTQNRSSSYTSYFESPASGDINTAPAADVINDYAQIVYGYVRPDVSGDYRFFLASDDNAQLWLSTDENPANAELIATEPEWNAVREYNDGKEDNWSDVIALQAGELYYIEARNSEGGGGDNLAVAWTFTTDGSEPTVPANGALPIPGANLLSNLPVVGEIQILSQTPSVGATGVYFDAGEFSISLLDGVEEQVNTGAIAVTVGGADVSVDVDSGLGLHVVTGSIDDQPMGATVEVVVSYETVAGEARQITWSFTTESIPTLDSSWASGLDQGGDRGFNVRVVQALDSADRANSTAAAEAQLQEDNPPSILDASDVFDLINFNQDADGGAAGNGLFRGASPTEAYQVADTNMNEAGLLTGLTDVSDAEHTNEWAMDIRTYLAFPVAGVYTLGVNSDDGFRITSGPTTDPADSQLELGVFDGGRGAANDAFQSLGRFIVETPGIYPIRAIAYEGGGGSSIELYSINNFGSDESVGVLVNDDGGIEAYVELQQ